jgi:probable phosphomutase (TIGR03848 family)
MTTILLVRHGQNDFIGRRLAGRLPGVHLNEAGRRQAETVAQLLAAVPLKAVYSSPLERAVETATPLARRLDLPVITRPGLMEIDFGSWTAKTMKQMQRMKAWKLVQEKPSEMRFPGGVSFAEAQQRIASEVQAIADCHKPDEMVACFSHSDAIKLAVAYFLGMPLDNFQRIAIDLTSITILNVPKEGQPHFWLINQITGLEFKRPEPKKQRGGRRKKDQEPTKPS